MSEDATTATNAKSRKAVLLSSAAALAILTPIAADAGQLINNNSLLISTTTYQNVGQVAGLSVGSAIPGGAAVSDGSLNTVWNNETVDASFGVTSAIALEDLNASNASVLASETLNPSQVVTSFSSKSELGLNITNTPTGKVATLMGYGLGGAGHPATAVGLLDVSNSDTSAYSDPTNPVTQFYGANYAFNRSVVAVNASGSYSVTPTQAYGVTTVVPPCWPPMASTIPLETRTTEQPSHRHRS